MQLEELLTDAPSTARAGSVVAATRVSGPLAA